MIAAGSTKQALGCRPHHIPAITTMRTRAEKARAPSAAPRDSSGVHEQISRVAATQPLACRPHVTTLSTCNLHA